MDENTVAELRMLRARAYAPNADIHEDPAALARLEELEQAIAAEKARLREPSVEASESEPRSADDSDVDAATEAEGRDAPELVPDADTDTEPEREEALARSGRRILMLGAIVLIAAVLTTAGLTYLAVRTAQADPRTVATLSADPAREIPEELGRGTVYQAFAGLSPVVMEPYWMGPPGTKCLAIVPSSSLVSPSTYEEVAMSSCEAGSFPAAVQLTVTDSGRLPNELRERFPQGTSLQFVLEDSSVVVLSDAK